MLDFIVSFSILIYVVGFVLGVLTLFGLRLWIVIKHPYSISKKVLILCLPASIGLYALPPKHEPLMDIYDYLMIFFITLQVLGSFYIIYTFIG
jgi:hypothetical protein